MATAVTLALLFLGGKGALVLAPTIMALLAAHSFGAVGGVLAATSVTERIVATRLLIKAAPHVHRINQSILIAIRDIAKSIPEQKHSGGGHIVAVVQGGPGGYGRAPVHFRWEPD